MDSTDACVNNATPAAVDAQTASDASADEAAAAVAIAAPLAPSAPASAPVTPAPAAQIHPAVGAAPLSSHPAKQPAAGVQEGAAGGHAASANGHAGSAAGGELLSTEYLQYLDALQRSWPDCPSIEISFDQLAYDIRNDATIADAKVLKSSQARRARAAAGDDEAEDAGVVAPTAKEENTPNLAKAFVQMVKKPFHMAQSAYRAVSGAKPDPQETLHALFPCSGIIRPGSMTLVLAPPGAGKSVLLRALSGRLSKDSGLKGELLYNGLTAQECAARGIYLTRLASYVGQNDQQFPALTVAETLEFAKANGVADVSLLNPDEQLRDMDARRTTLLMELLGLSECKDTYIGSDLMRGVSGGQRKRAQLGETMMSNARIYCLDEVSNGLDSAVTLHIFSALRQACAVNRSSIVTALQQVTPETYALFDSVILMREGHVLYHGPREGVRDWMRDVMHVPFIPDSLEEAGFIIDLLSDPKQALDKAALAHKVALAQAEGRAFGSPQPQSPPSSAMVAPMPAPGVASKEPLAEEAAQSGVQGVVRFHLDEEGDDAASTAPEQRVLAVPIAVSPSTKQVVPTGALAARNGGAKGSHGDAPFKLPAAELASVMDLELLLAANESAVETSDRRRAVADALAQKDALAAKSMNVSEWGAYSRCQYGQQFPHSFFTHTSLACKREAKLMSRNLPMVVPRLFSALLLGIVYSTLFYQLRHDDFASRLGIMQNSIMFVTFSNFQELPVASEAKQVVVRQIQAGFMPSLSYILAVCIFALPLAAAEVLLFGVLVYWIPGFEADAGRFFFSLFLLLSVSSAMASVFRAITYVADNADVAMQMNVPLALVFIVYGGFLIPRTSVQDWLIWAYYGSPFSWASESLASNEFSAPSYDGLDEHGVRIGDSYLMAYGLRTDRIWQWAGIIYLWGFYVVMSAASAILLKYALPVNPMGTKRARQIRATNSKTLQLGAGDSNATNGHVVSNGVGNGAANGHGQVHIEMEEVGAPNGVHHANGTNGTAEPVKRLGPQGARSSARASFQLSSLPFTPSTLSWKTLKYTVYVGAHKTPKVLLNDISGYAQPGKLTALMGASGAGKTTLLDVLAGRKTVGLLESEENIFINGLPKNKATFASITGYVEQTDLHDGCATVRESLDFSAKLRLPTSVDDATRNTFVEEVMRLVGLSSVQHRMVGDVSQPSLSTGQLKLLTIAVELVANPSILFLDEPTSGLDAKSAFRVMTAIKRIADTGRTIVCTIHQPSQEVFFMFDRLLLLRRGGEVVYFDEIGQQGDKLVSYLSKASRNLIPYSPLVSPANWMLDVVGLDASALIEEQKAEQELKDAENGADKDAKGKAEAHDPTAAPLTLVTNNDAADAVVPSEPQAESERADSKPEPHSDPSLQEALRRKVLAATKSFSATAKDADSDEVDDIAPIQFSEVWRQSDEAKQSQQEIDACSTPAADADAQASKVEKLEYVSGMTRLFWVVRRAYRSHWRSPPVNVTRFMLMLGMGIFLGVVYYQLRLTTNFASMSSLLAAVFLGVSLPGSICSEASLAVFFRQRAVYYREKSVGMYGYKIYTGTMTLVEAPYLLVGLLFFLIPFYFMVGLANDAGLFFKFLLPSYQMCLFFSFMEQIYIASLPNLIAAQALSGFIISIIFAFGGLYITASAIPIGWQWFYYTGPIPKSFIATMLPQVYCPPGGVDDPDARIDGCRIVDVPNDGARQVYRYVADMLEGDEGQYWYMIGWLFLTLVVLRAISVLMFKKINHIER